MSILQLTDNIEMITPLGPGHARFLWETPHELWWGVVQIKTGEMWWWKNHLIRFDINISEGRYGTSDIHVNEHLAAALAPHRKRYE